MQYESNPANGFRDIVWKRNTDARRTTRHDDDNITTPTSWAGDKKEHIRGILQFQAQALSTPFFIIEYFDLISLPKCNE